MPRDAGLAAAPFRRIVANTSMLDGFHHGWGVLILFLQLIAITTFERYFLANFVRSLTQFKPLERQDSLYVTQNFKIWFNCSLASLYFMLVGRRPNWSSSGERRGGPNF